MFLSHYYYGKVCWFNSKVHNFSNNSNEKQFKQSRTENRNSNARIVNGTMNLNGALIQFKTKEENRAQINQYSTKVLLDKNGKIIKIRFPLYQSDKCVRSSKPLDEKISYKLNNWVYHVIYYVFRRLFQSIGRWRATEKNAELTDQCYKATTTGMTTNVARQSEVKRKMTNLETDDLIYCKENNQATQRTKRKHQATVIRTANNTPRQQGMPKMRRGDQDDQHKVTNQVLNNYNEYELSLIHI